MKGRNVLILMLSVMLLLLTAGSSLAGGPQPTAASDADDMNAYPVANAPWFNIEVDTPGVTGQYTSVAINPVNDTTYISYYDYTNKELRLAMNKGFGVGNCGPNNTWLCQTVDTTYGVGQYSSIAVNPSTGEIGIAYYDATNGKLKFAHAKICPICTWSIESIDEPILFPTDKMGQYASLKYHTNGTPYIAYYFENTGNVDALKVASYVGSGGNCGYGSVVNKWQCDTIQTGEGVGQFASLAMDGSDRPRIAYYHGSNDSLMYAYHNGVSWTIREILPTNSGQYASLYVDVDNGNLPHIAHYDSSNGKLGYAVYKGSGGNCGFNSSSTQFEWQCYEIESVGTSTHPKGVSLAVDSAGYPLIAYQSADGSLKVARPVPALGLPGGSGNCGPENPFSTWYCEIVDPDNPFIPYRNGDYVSVAVHPSGLATIAYYGFIKLNDGNLNVSTQRIQVFLPLVLKDQ
jgi:hypothetical protein